LLRPVLSADLLPVAAALLEPLLFERPVVVVSAGPDGAAAELFPRASGTADGVDELALELPELEPVVRLDASEERSVDDALGANVLAAV
jgi:hypothetical protein